MTYAWQSMVTAHLCMCASPPVVHQVIQNLGLLEGGHDAQLTPQAQLLQALVHHIQAPHY